jgi:hypothetical protein
MKAFLFMMIVTTMGTLLASAKADSITASDDFIYGSK